jgi:hypothetical protein
MFFQAPHFQSRKDSPAGEHSGDQNDHNKPSPAKHRR